MKKRVTLLAGVVVLVAALVAAVSAGAATKQGTIKIAVIAPVATPIQNYPDAQAGTEAAVKAINAAGGVKGRQLEITFCNNQSNATVSISCARQAVSDGVVATIGELSLFSPLTTPILAQANIPQIGLRSFGNAIDWQSPNVFPIIGGPASNYEGIPFAFKKLGKKRLFISFQDVASAAVNAKNAKLAAKIAGIPVVGTMVLPGATTDFAPYVQRIRDANPDSVMFINSPGVSGGLIRAADSLGIKPLWAHNSGSIGEPEAKQIGPAATGMLLASDFPTFRDAGNAGIRKFLADMKAAGKDSDPVNLKVTGISNWLSVYALAEIAKKVRGDVTNTSLLAALRAQKTPINLFGLAEWAPGLKGPAAYPRWGTIKVYFLRVTATQDLTLWGPALPAIDVMKVQKFVR